eukprot:Nk52_evm1s667 gene=Nk52_evmTU1s667
MTYDRITQLQDKVDQMAHMLFNSLGVIQRDALPAELPGSGRPVVGGPAVTGAGGGGEVNHDMDANGNPRKEGGGEEGSTSTATGSKASIEEYSNLIAKTVGEIDLLVGSLPPHAMVPDGAGSGSGSVMDEDELRVLEEQSREAGEILKGEVREGEMYLGEVKQALRRICSVRAAATQEEAGKGGGSGAKKHRRGSSASSAVSEKKIKI